MPYITVMEFAKLANTTPSTVYRAIRKGIIKDYKIEKLSFQKERLLINEQEINKK